MSTLLGKTVAQRRKELRLSQVALASQCNLSRNYIALIERGKATNLSTAVLERLAVALQLPLASLLPNSSPEALNQSTQGFGSLGEAAPTNVEYETFIYLAVGLACWLEQQSPYPYPGPLQRALNGLALMALQSGKSFPSSFTELYQLLHKPIAEWWFGKLNHFPHDINPEFPLLYEGILDDQINDWLETYDMMANQTLKRSLQEIEAMKDQIRIKDLVQIARQDPQHQDSYVHIRRFLIEHPWTTIEDIFKETQTMDVRTLMQMYDSYDAFENLAIHDGVFWQCPYCRGILSWVNNVPRCAKPSVCGEMYHDYKGRTEIHPNKGILRLRWGLHTRVCIPGQTEIILFDWLIAQKERTDVIAEVSLWPGGDAYDIRIMFRDNEVWAIDLKDYANPVALARQIKSKSPPFFDPALKFDHIFYVVPDYRTRLNPSYIRQLKQNLVPFAPNMDAVTVAALRKRVLRRIAEMEKN